MDRTGFWMLALLHAFGRYRMPAFWWLHAMTAVWGLFTAMLFVIEPLWLHRIVLERARLEPERTFARVEWLHRGLLAASLVTLVGAVAGSHGLLWPTGRTP